MAEYHAALLSDIHAGFRYGLVPPSWWPKGRGEVDFTFKFYSYLYKCWTHFIESVPPLEVVFLNGDTLHGEDFRDRAINVISSDMMEQAHMALELLGPLRAKTQRIHVLKGTPYHDGRAHEALEWLATELDAELWSPGRHVGYSGYWNWRGHSLCLAHHQTSGWLYAAGGADRTALLHRAAEAEGKVPHADVIVRSHLHQKVIVKRHGIWSIQTPCWCAVFPWLEKVAEHSRARKQNDIGAIVAKTDDDGRLSFLEYDYAPAKERVREA